MLRQTGGIGKVESSRLSKSEEQMELVREELKEFIESKNVKEFPFLKELKDLKEIKESKDSNETKDVQNRQSQELKPFDNQKLRSEKSIDLSDLEESVYSQDHDELKEDKESFHPPVYFPSHIHFIFL